MKFAKNFVFVSLFAAASIVSHAQVTETQESQAKFREFSEFLDKYAEYKDQQKKIDNRKTGSKISGELVFDKGNDSNPCGEGYAECLRGVRVSISPDKNDLGAKAYVAILVNGAQADDGINGVLDQNSNYREYPNTRETYSFSIKELSSGNNNANFSIGGNIKSVCRTIYNDVKINIGVGYGTVPKMEQEFARRTEDQPEFKSENFNAEKFMLNHAYVNGNMQHKYKFLGSVYCKNGRQREVGGA